MEALNMLGGLNMPAFIQISRIRRCWLTSLIGSLPDPRVPILNAFITNIPNQKMPVDQPDRAACRILGCRSHECRLTSLIGRLPDPGMPFSMHLLQISRIRRCQLTSLIGQLAGSWDAVLMMPVDQPDRQVARSWNAVLMMPVDQPDRQLAGSWDAVLNAFITNIPNQKMPVDQPDRQIAGTQGAVPMMPVELPDRQLARSRNVVLMMPVDQPDRHCRIPECRSQCIYYKYPESEDAG
jgi:hypothetical protein